MIARNTATRATGIVFGVLLLVAGAPVAGQPAVGASPVDPNLDRAIAAQQRLAALQTTPRSRATALNDLANLLELRGDTDAALDHYQMAIAADETLASAHYNLALLAYAAGDDELASSRLESALAFDPQNAWAHYQLGRIADDADDAETAVAHYVRALSLDSRLAFADLNPHFPVNRYATEVLLKADRARVAALPPRSYSQPGRISGLLLPEVSEVGAQIAPAAGTESEPAAPPPGAEQTGADRTAEAGSVVRANADRPRRASQAELQPGPRGPSNGSLVGVTRIPPEEPQQESTTGAEGDSRVFTRSDLRSRSLATGGRVGAPTVQPAAPGGGIQLGAPVGPGSGGRQFDSPGLSGRNGGAAGGGRFQPTVRSSAQLQTTIRRQSPAPAP